MKNLANTKPPQFMKIGGNIYSVNYDYRTWIDIINLLEELDMENLTPEANEADILAALAIVEQIEVKAFSYPLDEDIFRVLRAVTGFAMGYPEHRNAVDESDKNTRLIDFEIDLSNILIAIRNQSGIDIANHHGWFHWWLFLLEFNNLTTEHHISKIMELRAYSGDDKDMQKARDAVALPIKYTKTEQQEMSNFENMFYNC
ncbi:MAG: Gp15 family bacteriophage protein [Clostridiales bacterium]